MTLTEEIETCILLGINVTFSKYLNQLRVEIRFGEIYERVILPQDHINDYKVIKYIRLMRTSILEKQENIKSLHTQ